MAEEAARRYQTAVDNVVREIEGTHLRRILGNVHRCAVRCCDDSRLSLERARTCLMRCSEPFEKAQSSVEGELGNFQERARMCVVQCGNDVRDQMNPQTTEAEAMKFKGQYDACYIKCAEKHIGLLPQLLQRLKDSLKHC